MAHRIFRLVGKHAYEVLSARAFPVEVCMIHVINTIILHNLFTYRPTSVDSVKDPQLCIAFLRTKSASTKTYDIQGIVMEFDNNVQVESDT